jgi:hypothetical protein
MFKSRNLKWQFCCLFISTFICVFSYKEAVEHSQKATLKGYYSIISCMLAVHLAAAAAMAVALWQNWKLIEMGCLAPGAVATVSTTWGALRSGHSKYNIPCVYHHKFLIVTISQHIVLCQ